VAEPKKLKRLSRGDVQTADPFRTEELEIPEWGGAVVVREFIGEERTVVEEELSAVREDLGAKVAYMKKLRDQVILHNVLADPAKDEPLFQPDDLAWLAKRGASAFELILVTAMKLSRFTRGDLDRLVEGLREAPADSSSTA
jgi:hypothetical protein